MFCSRRLRVSKFIGLSLAFLSFYSPKSYAGEVVMHVASSYPDIRVSEEGKATEKITCCRNTACDTKEYKFEFDKKEFKRDDLIGFGREIGLDLRFASLRQDKIHKKISVKGVVRDRDIPLKYQMIDRDRSRIVGIELPDCIEKIDYMALAYLCGLEKIIAPSNLSEIGTYAFAHSSNMDIQLPNTVKSVGELSFKGCYSMKEIDCAIESVGRDAFCDCEGLKKFNFSRLKSVGNSAFENTGLTKVKLGPKTKLSKEMFARCKNLISVEFDERYNDNEKALVSDVIPTGCFENCRSLISVKLPRGIKFVEDFAFSNCMSMNICDLSLCLDTLTEIREYAFNRCYSLIYLYDLKKSQGAMSNLNMDILARRNPDDAIWNLYEEPMKAIITRAKHCLNLLLNPKAFNALED